MNFSSQKKSSNESRSKYDITKPSGLLQVHPSVTEVQYMFLTPFLNVKSIIIYRFRKNPYQIPWRRFTKVGVAVSKKITDTEETVRVLIYGGKTATGIVPLGTKAMASWASGVLPTGLAPPPGSPGKGFPAGINP